jgi:hypothetical protein
MQLQVQLPYDNDHDNPHHIYDTIQKVQYFNHVTRGLYSSVLRNQVYLCLEVSA